MSKVLNKLVEAVERSSKTRYRIAQESGVSAAQLCHLVHGTRGLRIETAERLADYLGLEIVVRPKGRRTVKKK